MRDQRCEQRKGQRNVYIEPQTQPGLQSDILPNPTQHGLTATQKHQQSLQVGHFGALGRLRDSSRHLIDDGLLIGIASDREGFLKDLSALRVKGLANVLAEPTLITLSGRPCYIVSGGETPILTTSATGVTNVYWLD